MENSDSLTMTAPVNVTIWNDGNLLVTTGAATENALPKGTYYVAVNDDLPFDSSDQNYKLNIAAWADGAGNTGASALQLGNLTTKQTIQHTDFIGLADRNDYYEFGLSSATKVTISLAPSSSWDVDWNLQSVGAPINK
jgi:hypothetical protein